MSAITVRADTEFPRRTFPVRLNLQAVGADNDFPYSIEEARELAHELLRVVSEAEDALTSYVQVTFPSGGRRYTYTDPSGSLKVGDRALVDSSYGKNQIVEVVARGRGSYPGPTKALRAKLVVEEL